MVGSKRQQLDEHDFDSAPKRIRKASQKILNTLADDDEMNHEGSTCTPDADSSEIPRQGISRSEKYASRLRDNNYVDDLPLTSMLRGRKPMRNNPISIRDTENRTSANPVQELIDSIMADRPQYFHEISADSDLTSSSSALSEHRSAHRYIECLMSTLHSEKKRNIASKMGHTLADLTGDDSREGILLNAGGFVYSADWLGMNESSSLQYLAISASLDANANTIIGEKLSTEKKTSTIQIWSIDQKLGSKLEIVICCNRGRIAALRWVPSISSDLSESHKAPLGLIAACMQDGSVSVIPVPTRTSIKTSIKKASDFAIYLNIDPLIELDVKKGLPITLEWSNQGYTLAVGYSDGWLAAWNFAACLRDGSRRARPLVFYKIASSPISSLAWHPSGREIFVASYDGVTRSVQISQPHLNSLINHSRDVTYALAYCNATETLVMERPELDDVRSVIFIEGKVQSTQSYSHLGRVRVLSTSPHHSFIASGGVDGSVKVADSRLVMQKSRKSPAQKKRNTVSILYRLDLHRGKSSLRILDGLANAPPVYQSKHAMAASAAWDSSISISALRWNPNRSKKEWLASGTACGLVRIDII